MASVIHSLWERSDPNLLIMPSTVPMDDPRVQFELTRYLEEHWVPVIEKDVDGPHSLPLELDRENTTLGRYSACRRVARTIYMGSAPIHKVANRGIDDRRIRLGAVQPGESSATFGDALRRLSERATYLYVDGSRYWYSIQPTVARLADDRATQINEVDILDEINARLQAQIRNRGDFSKVHSCASSVDVPDERETRLIVLAPKFVYSSGDEDNPALKEARTILKFRGTSPRQYANTLVFLAPDKSRMEELKQAVRQFLAWKSIWDDKKDLNLDHFQTRQTESRKNTANSTVESRIPETYNWLLVPIQEDMKADTEDAIKLQPYRLQGHDPLAVRVSKKLKGEEFLVSELGGVRLRFELDRVPLWRGDHVGIMQLLEDFSKYVYLPRLKNEDVLLDAIKNGVSSLQWESDTFAYSEGFDESTKRYQGLVGGKNARVVPDSLSLLVRSEVAAKQVAEQSPTDGNDKGSGRSDGGGITGGISGGWGDVSGSPIKKVVKRFYGTVKVEPLGIGRQAGKVGEEIIQHLEGLVGSNVKVTLEIHAEIPDGVPETVVRIVTENCRTLQFDDFGFEEE